MSPSPRILIVCEDKIIANLASSMLQKKGFGILGILTTGQEALVKAAELVPDLVLMDVDIAGQMDAIDAGHYLFQLFHVPVLFICGATDEERLARIKYAQPYGIIFRPFTATQITTCVDLALYNHDNRLGTLGDLPVGGSQKMMQQSEEGIIILDKRGRVLLLNMYASWLVDVPLGNVFMRHWRDVMMFVSDTSGEEVNDPVTEATRQMAGAIYDASISLVSTTSKRRKVILAIRPIRDNHDRLIATVMTLKENKKTYM
jgi:two-component system, response regulator PdtaR